MSFRELDAIVLTRNIPDSNLKVGDLGVIVHLYPDDTFEVEFVTASGRAESLRTLTTADVRPVRDDDLLAVRPAQPLVRCRADARESLVR